MNERSLKYFEAVAAANSIRGASERLHVAPSAISRKVAELEALLGVRLLDRVGPGGVRCTEAGEQLEEYIKVMRLHEDNFLARLSDLQGLELGNVRIVTGDGLVSDLVSNALVKFVKEYPNINFIVNVRPGDEIVRDIRDDHADIGLLINCPPTDVGNHQSKIELVRSCRFESACIIVNAHDNLAERTSIAFSELEGVTLALLNNTFNLGQFVETAKKRHRVDLHPKLECNSFTAVIAFVTSGLGATILPPYCVAAGIESGHLKAIPFSDVDESQLTIGLIVNKQREKSEGITVLSRYIEKYMMAFDS